MSIDAQPRASGRIAAIDMARGIALIAMAIYHFTWDLEFFGYVERGLTAVGGWRMFARCIASSFLFLVGVSLYLAHRDGVRWPSFWQRWAMVTVAALFISVATWFAMADAFIFFGILHQIAIASLLGLLFLRLPAVAVVAVAVAVIALPQFFRAEFFDPRWFAWIGFSANPPRSNDFVPVFPWFGAVLLGIAGAKLAEAGGWLARLRDTGPTSGGILGWLGQHSLAFYLVHQPVLIGLVWTISQFVPANVDTPEVQFRDQCEAACVETRDEEFCARYCVCMLDQVEQSGGLVTEELRAFCTMSSEPDGLGQEGKVQGEGQ
jgi:uncharacterized membrane protein